MSFKLVYIYLLKKPNKISIEIITKKELKHIYIQRKMKKNKRKRKIGYSKVTRPNWVKSPRFLVLVSWHLSTPDNIYNPQLYIHTCVCMYIILYTQTGIERERERKVYELNRLADLPLLKDTLSRKSPISIPYTPSLLINIHTNLCIYNAGIKRQELL